jgi:thiol-disulfide isomerase/thioredoxin
MEPIRKEYDSLTTNFMKTKPASFLAPSYLRLKMGDMGYEDIKAIYDTFTEEVKLYGDGIDEVKSELAALEKILPGKEAPDFTAKDINGNDFTLSSLKGKVVILDFWASWCVPCRKSNPHVKALYEKYRKKGFDVVYVADNDSRPEDALKAIEQDGIKKYHHVLRGLKIMKDANGKMTGYDKSEDVSEQYAIHFLPTKYLIDREGNIIGKVTDEELDAKLKEIFGF